MDIKTNDRGERLFIHTDGRTEVLPGLRDEFAKAALTGMLVHRDWSSYSLGGMSQLAKLAYALAEAMLSEREEWSK